MSASSLSAAILAVTLALFLSGRVRHDLVALAALFLALATGLVQPGDALDGFADPAVISVAAVLVVGRAIELSGAAGVVTRVLVPAHAPFGVRLGAVLVVAALLSAFMNNIAALVVTMPIATQIAREARQPPSAVLMPLAFATILGGMTTLIGTPANLILSSVREDQLGEGFGFFTMTPVGTAVALAGLAYLLAIGIRLLPKRDRFERSGRRPWRVFELEMADEDDPASLRPRLRKAHARLLAKFDTPPGRGDRLLVLSRDAAPDVASRAGLKFADVGADAPGDVTARVSVAHGSFLLGLSYAAVQARSEGTLRVVAGGPRTAGLRIPLAMVRIEAGDQLYVRGQPAALARFVTRARLLEIDRLDPLPVAAPRAALTVATFVAAIIATIVGGVSPAITFLAAAAAMAAARLIPADEIYRAIDWPVIVLLAAMIPVGQSFATSGAADIAAAALGAVLADVPLAVALAAICAATLLLSIFLNNVATAVIMGPLAIQLATILGVSPDAALLAVLIGASSDFLTPIGHQNNLLVMGPGGYRFTDFARVGALLTVIVVAVTAGVLSATYA